MARVTPWQVDESDYPASGTFEEKVRFLLRYAVLAPSGHNTQPWKFAISDEGVLVYSEQERRLPVADPDDRELVMSIGAAIMNLRVAAARFAFSSEVAPTPDPDNADLLALVRLKEGGGADQAQGELFEAIVRRRTNRFHYENKSLSESDLVKLAGVGRMGGAAVRIITEAQVKSALAGLLFEGDVTRMSDKAFREELALWMRPANTEEYDGLAGDSLGLSGMISRMAPWMTKTFNMGKSTGKKDRALAKESAALVVALSGDQRADLLDAGQLFEKFVLTGTLLGVQYSFFNLAVEVPELRQKIKALLAVEELPQLLFRIGYTAAGELKPAARLPLEDVFLS